jgi:hypothetical protein
MSGASLYSCFDFRLRSEIPLIELRSANKADSRPLVDIRLGRVPETLPGGSICEWGLQVAGGDALLSIDGVGRFLIRSGREIVVEPAPQGSERGVRLFLLGSAIGILCHQRGLMPLHANAVVAGDGAFAFAGQSGAGKSTLAAHFSRAGYPVLCDDVCVIGFAADGTPMAWPGLPRLKLWSDAVEAFGHGGKTLERAVDGFDKYHVPLPVDAEARPVPLRRLYVLTKAAEGEPGAFRPLRGFEAMRAVITQTYRGVYLRALGLSAQNFRHAAALLAHAEAWEASRAWGYTVFGQEAGRIEQHILTAAQIAATRKAS